MFKLDLEKGEESDVKLPASAGSSKKKENSRKTSTSLLLTILLKPLTAWITKKLWKILQEIGIPDHLTCSWEICMQVKKQQLQLDMEQQTGSKSGKEFVKAIYCYLASVQSLSSVWLFATPWTAQASLSIINLFPLGLTGWISLQSKGLSESSPTLPFKSINSSVLSHPYGPAITYVHDYWKNHSFDHTNLCWQSNVSTF